MPASVSTPSTSVAKSRIRLRVATRDFVGRCRFRAAMRSGSLDQNITGQGPSYWLSDGVQTKKLWCAKTSDGRDKLRRTLHEPSEGILPCGKREKLAGKPLAVQH